jgi:beta-glucanase (GH16 family)
MVVAIALIGALLGGSQAAASNGGRPDVDAPVVSAVPALNGAEIVSISSTPGATIYYTLDGSTPNAHSQIYEAPFLVATNLTVEAIAIRAPGPAGRVAKQTFTTDIPSGTLVWADEFANASGTNAAPDPKVWTYDTGYQCCGNHEQETYCAWGSNTVPCDASNPSVYAGVDGYLHMVARALSSGVYSSGRVKSQGRISFLYGRIEARMKLPESQGMWPAFWMLGNNIATIQWPACGELDIMEHIDGSVPPEAAGGRVAGYDWIAGSVHGGPSGHSEINGSERYHASGFSAADWHVYGMIWSKGQVEFYVDDPANVYATYKSTDAQWANKSWPFDAGPQYLLLNLAVGGDWPGNVDSTTVFPSETLVDYVRVYKN